MEEHASNLIDCYFVSPETGWVVGGKSDKPKPDYADVKPVVLHTTDGGRSWDNRLAGQEDQFPLGEWGWKIQFLNERIGFVSLENFNEGAILVTTDGGETWTRRKVNDAQGNANLEGIGFIDEKSGWVGGWGNASFQGGFSSVTDNGGLNWDDANQIGRFINRFRFIGKPLEVAYASGRTVYKYSRQPVPEVARLVSEVEPSLRFLESNEPVTTGLPLRIFYVIPRGTKHVSILIWSRFGAHVRQLIDEYDPRPGTSIAEWDGRDEKGDLPPENIPPTFIYRITLDQQQAESRIVHLRR